LRVPVPIGVRKPTQLDPTNIIHLEVYQSFTLRPLTNSYAMHRKERDVSSVMYLSMTLVT